MLKVSESESENLMLVSHLSSNLFFFFLPHHHHYSFAFSFASFTQTFGAFINE